MAEETLNARVVMFMNRDAFVALKALLESADEEDRLNALREFENESGLFMILHESVEQAWNNNSNWELA